MLTIEVSDSEEEGQEEEGLLEEEACPAICVNDEVVGSEETRRKMAIQRAESRGKFQLAVSKVQLGIKVVRKMQQFHTTKTVARAIDGPKAGASNKKKGGPTTDLGHFPLVLRMICKAVRKTEQCYLVVELVSPRPDLLQYLVMLRTTNEEGIKEDMMLGAEADVVDGKPVDLRFCVGSAIKSHVTVQLAGDGSFMICDSRTCIVMKPASIQSQWAAVNFLNDSMQNALDNNYFEYGKSHKWCAFYTKQFRNSELQAHGNAVKNWKVGPSSRRNTPRKSIMDLFDKRNGSVNEPVVHAKLQALPSLDELSKLIILKIREVMYQIDLDTASCKSIRTKVEDAVGMSLDHYKEFIEERILLTLGQMDEPSLIKDYLYLGSEWNACNYEELLDNGITHILNVTSEIDSPFESSFIYHRIEVLDVPEANLLKHWETTHDFIKKCRDSNGKVLVHCQMGVSRSGSTTISYMMREYGLALSEATSHVTSRRTCVKPNPGFEKQLQFYQTTISEHGALGSSPHGGSQLSGILATTDITHL